MIARIDAAITARIFQPIVDLVQLRPAWLGRQAAILLMLLAIWRCAETGMGLWSVVNILCVTIWIVATFIEPVYARFSGSTWIRYFAMFDVAATSLLLLLAGYLEIVLLPTAVVRLVAGTIGLTSYFYFATCRPPRPRAPRRKASLARVG